MPSQPIIPRLEEWMRKYRLPLMPVIWGVTCLIIGILVAMGLYGYSSAEKAMADQFNQQQLVLARQAAQGMESYLGNLRQTLPLLTRIPEIRNPKKGRTEGREEEVLKVLGEQLGGAVDFLFQVDERGELISSYPAKTLEGIAGKAFDFGPYFREARTTGKPSLVHVGPWAEDKNQPSRFGFLLFLSPVFRGSEPAGFLGAGIDFKKIYDRFVHPIRSGTQGASWMIDQEGKIIAKATGTTVPVSQG